MKLLNCAATLACCAALTTACAAPSGSSSSSGPTRAPDEPAAAATALTPPAPAASPAASALPVADPRTTDAQTQLARYTTLSLRPSDADENPLVVIATVHFPRQVVRTVGDAVRYLLIRTGYQLAPVDTLDPRVNAVFGLPLPDNQRALGPYRVDSMLTVLMGHPYQLATDRLTRTVSYTAPAAPASGSAPMVGAGPTAGLASNRSN